jgi:hypothetical protein
VQVQLEAKLDRAGDHMLLAHGLETPTQQNDPSAHGSQAAFSRPLYPRSQKQ